MRKIVNALALVISLCMALVACKLTTIRPTLITRIVAEDLAIGTKVERSRKTSQELDWLMDDLVFLMERQFEQTGACTEEDGHLYYVEYYMDDRLEFSVYVNSDGSVCKDGRRHVIRKDGEQEFDPVDDLEKWAEFFDFDSE